MNTMEYKGYTARIEYSAEDRCLFGVVSGIDEIIDFHADNITDLEREFHATIDFYLDCCRREGKEPEAPYSGEIVAYLNPRTLGIIRAQAEATGKSIDAVIENAIKTAYPRSNLSTKAAKPAQARKKRVEA